MRVGLGLGKARVGVELGPTNGKGGTLHLRDFNKNES